MKYLVCIALIAAVAFAADNLMLDEAIHIGSSEDMLQYDDGTSWWLTWGGLYRGVWFNTADFYGSQTEGTANQGEFWFYHYGSPYEWDTSSFYSELYDGGVSGPETELDQTSVTATHNSPVYVEYGGIQTAEEFWQFINTEMSSGNWPSILGDNTPNSVDHSFFSDDMIVWEPWVIQGPGANDYFDRMSDWVPALEEETWGSIKSLF
ncbi:hypothetical protein GF402_03455 [Candidatus Fermentibacteria bacterium]|nr:hypothetical protein [Candidatus Fermentibacteria bacterium]